MKIGIIIISFILENILSNFLPINSLFSTLLTLLSLILIYPYCNGKNGLYLKYCFFTGLAYDLIYTDTLILNAFIFTFIGFIITKLNLFFSNNCVNDSLMAIIVIIIYRVLCYGILIITANMKLNALGLLKSIYSSIIINIIYIVIGFTICDKIAKRLKIRRTN